MDVALHYGTVLGRPITFFMVCYLPSPQALRISHRGERETRVTGNEAQWTMGRTKKTRESPFRPFSPSHLPLRANFYPERERRLGTRQDCCRVAGESGPKFAPDHSHSAFRYNTSSKIRAFKELSLNI